VLTSRQHYLLRLIQDPLHALKAKRGASTTIDTLRKDAENQKEIMAKKAKKATKGPTEVWRCYCYTWRHEYCESFRTLNALCDIIHLFFGRRSQIV
jgi:hypothetical protein